MKCLQIWQIIKVKKIDKISKVILDPVKIHTKKNFKKNLKQRSLIFMSAKSGVRAYIRNKDSYVRN